MPIYFKGHRINDVVVGTASGSTAGATLTNASDLRAGLIAYGRYGQVTGTMQDLAATTYTPGTTNQTITAGKYIAGTQTILGDSDLVAGNIKSGVTIFGVTGTYSGGGGTTINNQNKTVTPTTSQQSITADSGYTGLGTVTVNAIQTETKSVTPGASAQTITPSNGKYLTSVSVAGDSDLISGNIKSGINIFGVTGTYSGAGITLQSKTVTPTKSQQTVSPDTGYDALSQVTVDAIPAAYITTSDATATAAQILNDKTAYVNGSKVTGTMANNGATGGTISTQGGTYTIPTGYTSGGTVTASLPTGSTTAANISGAAFEETTGDYGFRTSVQIQPGYYASATTVTKDFSSMLPAPTTEGTSAQVLAGYDLYNHNGQLISGTMTNNSIGTITLDQTTTSYIIPAGYHNGTGKVQHTTVNIPDPTITVNSSGLITASGSWTRGFTTDNSYSKTSQLSTQAAATITPSETAQTAVASGKYTTGAVTVAAIPSDYVGSNITTRSSSDLTVSGATITAPAGYYASSASKSVATMTLPTSASSSATSGYTSKATIGRSTSAQYINIPPGYNSAGGYYTISAVANGSATAPASISGTAASISTGTNTLTLTKTVSVTPSVTAGYISSGTAGNSSVSLTANVTVNPTPTASGATVTIPAGYYTDSTTKSVTSGSAGTPIATKGAVSNHSVLVTPSVTNTTGYITGGTKTGTAVTVNASELVSGSETKTENGTYDVTNLAELVVNVQGGGESGVQVETVWQSSSTSSSVVFSNLKGNPTSFIISIDGDGTTPTATPMTDAIVFDGTNLHAQTIVSGTNAVVYDNTSYSKSYSNGTLTITSASKAFDTSRGYAMTYSYGGSASNIGTKDVQVGSGATSITFTGLPHEPLYWSCIFKSNFSTSSGYQRVIFIQKAGSTVYGHCMDSATRESVSYWTASYSGGNLTITSNGTNNGGYFHQPGYYQLTYATDDSAPSYQTKTVTPTTSQQIITADNGYDALSQVTVNAIPNTYVQPTATKGATTYTPGTTNQTIAAGTYLTGIQTIIGDADLIASNIKSGVNIFGVAGTYSGLDTSDATATAGDIVSGKTAYVNGREVEGSLVVQTYYTGSTTPGSSLGINGDIYLQS